MINDSYVAINVYNNLTKKLLNKNFIPILFYWNGDGNIIDNIICDEKFINEYINTIKDINEYNNINISYFYFKYDDNKNENYEENTFLIKDYINFDQFESNNLVISIIFQKFCYLYNICFNKKYESILNEKDAIMQIYNDIKNKYKNKLNNETIVNWLRSELIKEKNYTSKNINIIIANFKTTIKLN